MIEHFENTTDITDTTNKKDRPLTNKQIFGIVLGCCLILFVCAVFYCETTRTCKWYSGRA
jgi:hypothetical protein